MIAKRFGVLSQYAYTPSTEEANEIDLTFRSLGFSLLAKDLYTIEGPVAAVVGFQDVYTRCEPYRRNFGMAKLIEIGEVSDLNLAARRAKEHVTI